MLLYQPTLMIKYRAVINYFTRKKISHDQLILIIIFTASFLIRFSFAFYFQKYFFGKITFHDNETETFLLPFINLVKNGTYQFDMYLEDSKYYRVPVYPFFIGTIHYIFGNELMNYIVATIQVFIDSISSVLVYLIILISCNDKKSAIASSVIYATYPFVILWTPIVITEIVQIHLMWWMIVVLLYFKKRIINIFFVGIICGLLVLTKQYLGILLVIPVTYIIISFRGKILKMLTLLSTGFLFLLSIWVARNYISSNGNIVILRGKTTGYRSILKDYESFEKFANLFDENITPALYSVSNSGTINFNKHYNFVYKNKYEIDYAVKLAYRCGDSFLQRRNWIPFNRPPYKGCADDVSKKFDMLVEKFWKDVSFFDLIETRIDAVVKIFNKKNIISNNNVLSGMIERIFFSYRLILLIFGFISLFIMIIEKNKLSISIIISSISFYFYFSVIIVHVEMRYLLIPDLLVTIMSGFFVKKIISINRCGKYISNFIYMTSSLSLKNTAHDKNFQ